MPGKKKNYCGDAEELPKGYKGFGTRFECLKKGYGSALIYSTEEQRHNALMRMMEKPPKNISKEQLSNVALKINVNTLDKNGRKKTKDTLIKSIIKRLKKF